jgi:uncharacterized membrane protein
MSSPISNTPNNSGTSHTRGNLSHILKAVLTALFSAVLIGGATVAFTAAANTGSGSYAEMTYSNVNYHTVVKSNGDIRVTQTVTMNLEERDDDEPWRQLFQQYKVDTSQYSDISNVSVRDDDSGETFSKARTRILPSEADDEGMDWDTELAHTWYEIHTTADEDDDSSDEAIEIGWNIPETYEASTRTFTISMTFDDAVIVHPDVAEFQWEPIGRTNTIPIDHVSGTVQFPKGIDEKTSWAWLHYKSTSTTQRGTNGELKFTADDVTPGTYLDVRAMFDAEAMGKNVAAHGTTDEDEPAKSRILQEETQKETEWNADVHRRSVVRITLWIATAIAVLGLSIWGLTGMVILRRGLQYTGPLDYWREPPAMSPAAAAHLLGSLESTPSKKTKSRVLTSTLLSLASKKTILLLPGVAPVAGARGLIPRVQKLDAAVQGSSYTAINDLFRDGDGLTTADPKATTVVLLQNTQHAHLSSSERHALQALKKMDAAAGGHGYFDLTTVSDRLKMSSQRSHAISASNELKEMQSSGEAEFDQLKALQSRGSLYSAPILLLFIVGHLAGSWYGHEGQVLLGIIFSFVSIFVAVLCAKLTHGKVLTPAGQKPAGEVLGLRNFLLDFSSFKDRGAQDLTLWDRYLVYAAAFGISKEAATQLAKNYPQLTDASTWDSTTIVESSLLYCYYRPFWGMGRSGFTDPGNGGFTPGSGFAFDNLGTSLASNLSDIQSTISSATSSSSSSGSSGGSFSGGDGFGGGGGGFGGGSFGGR